MGTGDTARLNTEPNLDRPDDFYAALIQTHDGCSEAESRAVNARLILLLANHIGDHAVLAEALRLARYPPANPEAGARDSGGDG